MAVDPFCPWWISITRRKVRAVEAAGIKSKSSNGEHLQEYRLSRDHHCQMMEALGMDTLSTNVFASQEAPKLH